jgi:hypothetical protein
MPGNPEKHPDANEIRADYDEQRRVLENRGFQMKSESQSTLFIGASARGL